MRYYIVILSLLVFQFFYLEVAQSQEECFYDMKAIDKQYFLNHTKFVNAEWDNEKKEAKVELKGGEAVIVQYSACTNLGMTARYEMKKTTDKLNSLFLLEKIKWLGKKVLDKEDYITLVRSLKDKVFLKNLKSIRNKERFFLSIQPTYYQSFILYVVNYKDDFYIEISWAM